MKKFFILSRDADDWNELQDRRYTLENSIYGVLLYPKKGTSKSKVTELAEEFLYSEAIVGDGDIKVFSPVVRGEHWAIPFEITSIYNPFNLQEFFD